MIEAKAGLGLPRNCTRDDRLRMPILVIQRALALPDCARISRYAVTIARTGAKRIAVDMASVQKLEFWGACVLSKLWSQLANRRCELMYNGTRTIGAKHLRSLHREQTPTQQNPPSQHTRAGLQRQLVDAFPAHRIKVIVG